MIHPADAVEMIEETQIRRVRLALSGAKILEQLEKSVRHGVDLALAEHDMGVVGLRLPQLHRRLRFRGGELRITGAQRRGRAAHARLDRSDERVEPADIGQKESEKQDQQSCRNESAFHLFPSFRAQYTRAASSTVSKKMSAIFPP